MEKIRFEEKDHKYLYGDIYLRSVTSILSELSPEFNANYISKGSAYKKILGEEEYKRLRKEVFGFNFKPDQELFFPLFDPLCGGEDRVKLIQQEFLQEWEDSGTRGTAFHKERELESIARGYEYNPWADKDFPVITFEKNFDNEVYSMDLFEMPDGYYTELLVYDKTLPIENTICGTIDRLWIETIDGVRYTSTGDYKGLALDTIVPTIDGWKIMEELQVGDMIFDGKGNPTKIKHISELHYNPCYKITFDNNEQVVCDHEHRWVISKLKHKYNKKQIYFRENEEMTTDDLFEYYQNNKSKLAIEINVLNTEEKDLPIDPYILGLWLADGNRNCGTITCKNNDIWEEIKKRGFELSINHNRNNGGCESRTIFNILKSLKSLNLIKNKHIPNIYLRASFSQRLDLLRGYMDGDGYFNKPRNRYNMMTTNIRQAKDIQTLVSSLGHKCTIIPYKTTGFGKENIQAYQISFRLKYNPFLVRNKDAEQVMRYNDKNNFNYIKKIEKVDTVPTKCLAVESPEKTYLFGNSLIMTHNTNANAPKNDKFSKMKPPLDHLWANKVTNYSLQASWYQMMLESHGFTPKDASFTWYKDYNVNDSKEYPVIIMRKEVELIRQYVKNLYKQNINS